LLQKFSPFHAESLTRVSVLLILRSWLTIGRAEQWPEDLLHEGHGFTGYGTSLHAAGKQ
jgi:hypothetical protein